MKNITPFLKWAGGKRWLVSRNLLPTPESFNNYIEPFLGSGAVFFSLAPEKAILADSNKELVVTYNAIKSSWPKVYEYLVLHHSNHSSEYYYRIRSFSPSDRYERAARFIYLNRTCWNGLYRVNRNGVFNVPIGTKQNVLTNEDDFKAVSALLKKCTIQCTDFEKTIDKAAKEDFVYVDPPYTINHGNNGFIKYNEHLFQWSDQIRLHDAVLRARQRGAFVVISNAYHSSIEELYKGSFKLHKVSRFSVISGSVKGRTMGYEYLITGV